jgi:phage antirepressor YoqD-like protein
VTLRITRWDGLIDVEQAAGLCGVKAVTIRAWTQRGYGPKDARRKLPVAKRENGLILLDPVEVARADHATRGPARRMVFPVAA